MPVFNNEHNFINIHRFGRSGNRLKLLVRMWNYLKFYGCTLLYLVAERPNRILYYETISSFPAIFFKNLFKKNTEIFIHYHEYTSPSEYESGMKLGKVFHKLERKIYPLAKWVSHTNEQRMHLFEKDLLPVRLSQLKILPNYPPRSWLAEPAFKNSNLLRVVYIGALSTETMFVKEFSSWVKQQRGFVSWDIYSYNVSPSTKEYLAEISEDVIKLKPGVCYSELPKILEQYDVGIILYRGHIENYIYNATNKLFEYHSCGLDVWYPSGMDGINQYARLDSIPKIVPINFELLSELDLRELKDHKNLPIKKSRFYCEDALKPLVSCLCGRSI